MLRTLYKIAGTEFNVKKIQNIHLSQAFEEAGIISSFRR